MQTECNYLSRGRVVVNFVPKFIAMATRVVRGKIQMTLSDSAGPKKGRCKQSTIIFYGDQVIAYRFEISIGCNTEFCNF